MGNPESVRLYCTPKIIVQQYSTKVNYFNLNYKYYIIYYDERAERLLMKAYF